jgi:cytochrome P450
MNIMQSADLPELPIDTMEFSANAFEFLAKARRHHPWLARFSQGYVVYGYQAVADLLVEDEHLVPGPGPIIDFYGVRGTMWARFMDELLTSTTGAKHDRLRKSVSHAFTPRRANQVRPLMRQVITDLLDEWTPKGEFDFAYFASFFPVTVMCGLLGVSAEAVSRIRSAIEDHISSLSMDLATKPKFLAAWETLWEFADTLVKDREAQEEYDPDSLLDALIEAKKSGQMDETELRFMLLTVLIAGYDTSKNLLTVIMMILLDHPDMYERCAHDADFCGKVVQEALRHTSIATPYREVAEAFAYGGFQFEKGDLLILGCPLAGRDAAVFPDPQTFDPERLNANRHLGLGRGSHICLGQFIAKAQLQEGIHLIAQRLKNPRQVGETEWRPFIGAWGLKNLPLAFDFEEQA